MPSAAVACATLRTATYRRRQPERTVLYRIVQTHLATWLELAQDESCRSIPAHVERPRALCRCGSCRRPNRPRGKATCRPNRYRTTNSISALHDRDENDKG